VAGSCWAGDIVKTILGEKFWDATPMLRILFLAAMARMLCASNGWVFVVLGRPGRMLRWQLMWTPFVVLSFIVGIRWGAVGVAAGYTIANWIAFFPSFFYCFRGTAFSIFDMVEPVAPPLFCTVFSTALALGGQLLLFPGMELGKWRLLVRILFACTLYAATTIAFVPIVREGWNRFRGKSVGAIEA
jgi:O-antigen/teichoic acid export membrane protein